MSKLFILALSFKRNTCSSSWGERRGRAQDQDRGTVANLRNHCKLICIDVNEKDTFPVPKYMNLIYVI
jgi:hypothetical protein